MERQIPAPRLVSNATVLVANASCPSGCVSACNFGSDSHPELALRKGVIRTCGGSAATEPSGCADIIAPLGTLYATRAKDIKLEFSIQFRERSDLSDSKEARIWRGETDG